MGTTVATDNADLRRKLKDAALSGTFIAACAIAMFGWFAALGWASLHLVEWTLG